MRKRTQARQLALQILYQVDITNDSLPAVLDNFWNNQPQDVESAVREFTLELVKGIQRYREAIDRNIAQYAENWNLKRMAVVDRNILRQACFELLYCPDIPPKVAINEAIELAKRFSGVEAGKFINGILDKIKLEANQSSKRTT